MMQATLTYELPEDAHDHLCAVHATALADTLTQIRGLLRTHTKHGIDPVQTLDLVGEQLRDITNVTGIDL